MTMGAERVSAERALAIADASQRRASDPGASSWVSANAGTGKTTVLTNRVLRLLLAGTPPKHILCLTFTKAAAAEMANRVTAALAQWATMDDGTLQDSLARLTGVAPDGGQLDAARRLFATVLDAPGGLRVQTIHAFCQSVLKRFPLEAGVAPHFTVMDERDSAELLTDARNTVLSRARRAAEAGDEPGADSTLADALAAVTAYAGEARFSELIGELVARRGRLRGLAQGPAVLEDWVDGLYRRLAVPPGETERGVVGAASEDEAFDAAALQPVAEAMMQGAATDRRHGRIIADWLAAPGRSAASWDAYLSAFFTDKAEPRRTLIHKEALALAPDGAEVLAAECARLGAVRERCKALTVARASASLLRLGAAALDAYGEAKHGRALLDYDDLIFFTQRLLTGRSATAWVLYKLDGGIDHILIDEAQDTSPEQWRLVQALAEELFAGEGAERGDGGPTAGDRTLFAVGDHKQSIFSIQGANPDWFEAMREHFADRAAAAQRQWRPVDLEVSFRSTEAVLGAVDAVFGAGPARDGVVVSGDIRHLAQRAGQRGVVEVWPLVKAEPSSDLLPWSPPEIEQATVAPRLRLARHIAATIDRWIRDREPLVWERKPGGRARPRPVRPGDIMILVRRREGFVEEVVGELKGRGVPVAGVDRMKLTQQLAVQDLMALGAFLLLPEDDLTLATVLKGPLIGLDEDALFTLAHGRGDASLWRRLADTAGRKGPLGPAYHTLADLLSRADFTPPYELYAEVLEAGGGRRKLLARLGPDADDPIDEFLGLALVHQRQHPPSLQGFLHWIEAGETEVKRDLEHGAGAVRVMTVHGAKGLQAPIVVLPDTTGLPPVQKPALLWPDQPDPEPLSAPLWAPLRTDEEAVTGALRAAVNRRRDQEYRRLLYVAMTRAADRLYVCGWEAGRKPAEGCWYNLIAEALADRAEPVDFDFGAGWAGRGWRLEAGRPGRPAAASPDTPAEAPPPLPGWATRPPPPEPDPPTPLAPSRSGEEEPAVRSPLDGDDGVRFRRGRLIHRLLQTLPDVDPASREAAARRFLVQPTHDLPAAELDHMIGETLAVLDHPGFAPLFGPGSLAEAPVSGLVPGPDGTARVLFGQVDRLLVADDHVIIVDYKTNRPPPPTEAEVPRVYLRQMAAYRTVLKQIYPDREVRCALIWTDGPRLMELLQETLDSHAPS